MRWANEATQVTLHADEQAADWSPWSCLLSFLILHHKRTRASLRIDQNIIRLQLMACDIIHYSICATTKLGIYHANVQKIRKNKNSYKGKEDKRKKERQGWWIRVRIMEYMHTWRAAVKKQQFCSVLLSFGSYWEFRREGQSPRCYKYLSASFKESSTSQNIIVNHDSLHCSYFLLRWVSISNPVVTKTARGRDDGRNENIRFFDGWWDCLPEGAKPQRQVVVVRILQHCLPSHFDGMFFSLCPSCG